MAYPDLYNDEHKVLEAKNVKVKSVSFTVVLTNRRLILIDSKRQSLPPQEILLATLKNVDSGENAIRDPTITLSIITTAGATRQMILTFSNTAGGERKRECDEWVRALRQNLSRTIEHPILPDIPTLDEAPQAVSRPDLPPGMPAPKIEVVNPPQQKKRIEISRPVKTIVETTPAMPKPVETTSLPVGSFCNRCGSRVPPDSAFCNRCGTPVAREPDREGPRENQVQSPPPVITDTPLPVTEVPHVSVPSFSPPAPAVVKRDRPIEEVIHSIEPLIEDSVPRTPAEPAVVKHPSPPAPEPPAAGPETAPAETEVQWPVIRPSAPDTDGEKQDRGTSHLPPPPVPPGTRGGKSILPLVVIALVVIAAIAGVFIFANPLQLIGGGSSAPAGTPVSTPVVTTPPVTTAAVVVSTPPAEVTKPPATMPAPAIPQTGVWIRINYANEFSGSVGTPGALREVTASGETYYQISTSTGTVVANIQKNDGSADRMTVALYKDGDLITEKSTSAPLGLIEIQVSLKPPETPSVTPSLVATPLPEPSEPDVTSVGNSTGSS